MPKIIVWSKPKFGVAISIDDSACSATLTALADSRRFNQILYIYINQAVSGGRGYSGIRCALPYETAFFSTRMSAFERWDGQRNWASWHEQSVEYFDSQRGLQVSLARSVCMCPHHSHIAFGLILLFLFDLIWFDFSFVRSFVRSYGRPESYVCECVLVAMCICDFIKIRDDKSTKIAKKCT